MRGTLLLTAGAFALFAVALAWPGGPRSAEPLLVADLRGHALIVLDPTRPEDARRIALPGAPHELLRLPDGRVVTSLEQSGAIAFVDVDSQAVEVLEVGGLPHGLALAPGASAGADVLLVTDRAVSAVRRFAQHGPGWREIESLPSEAWPHAVAVLPSGEVAVASAQPGSLRLGEHRYATGGLTESVAVAPDGRVAVAAAQDGRVEVYRDGVLLERHDVGGRPVRVAFSPDGRTLAAALSAVGEVALIRGGHVTIAPVSGIPDGLAYSSDGTLIYASDVYAGTVTALDLTGRVLAVIKAGDATGALLAWSAH